MDTIYFFGRFHVLALHLPIGIVCVAVVLDWVARREPYRRLAVVSPFLWGAAALSALLTVALGYMHFAEGAFTGPSANAHRFFGTTVAVAAIVIWALSLRPELYRRVNIATGILAVALVSLTGHFGGDLTHGSTFLWQYAPGPLRSLAGATRRAPVKSVAAADPYLDVIQPMLERRCGGCHNGDKHENGFSMASYESTLKGGDTGRVIVPGKSDSSDLYRRISLPHDDKEFMPAKGKTPLTDQQVAILKWWIDTGAPHGTTVADVGADTPLEGLLASELGLVGAAPSIGAAAPAMAADSAVVDRIYRSGFLVRQVSQTDPSLVVSVYSPGKTLGRDQLEVLATAAEQVVDLNLQNAGLGDEATTLLERLAHLERLRLSYNRVSDAGLEHLEKLQQLAVLNLYGNPGITDSGIAAIAAIKSLKHVYLWGTGVSPKGVARLRAERPDLAIDIGAVAEGETAANASKNQH